MRLLRVEAEGLTTSFRYPFFMMGRHPTFPMPPPATIYGHICSALGEWVSTEGLQFGYWFTHVGRGADLEHIHLLSDASGTFQVNGERFAKRTEGNVNPFTRDLLFQPKLTLYINRPDWLENFRNPYYPVVLGRSQDLFAYRSVDLIDAPEESAYIENTLVPFGFQAPSRGQAVVMPRFIDYMAGRQTTFENYIILTARGFPEAQLPVDPEAPPVRDSGGAQRRRGIVLHSFRASQP